jgi:uncharacterized protein YyaL (SSP411 family)
LATPNIRGGQLDKTYEQIRLSYDAAHGGFGEAPLFPRPVVPDFLLRYWSRTGKRDALDMVLNNLRSMAAGGVHDQIGGGFHRYSTDGRWRVPNFENMLYDQAQLAMLYTCGPAQRLNKCWAKKRPPSSTSAMAWKPPEMFGLGKILRVG